MPRKEARTSSVGLPLKTALGCALGCSLVLASREAAAFDGCFLRDTPTGTGLGVILPDDTTVSNYGFYGKSALNAETAIDGSHVAKPNMFDALFLNAALSDVHVHVWYKNVVDIADTSLNYGGDGTFFRGNVFGFRCPKGFNCSLTVTPGNNNQAWQCQREFYRSTLFKVPMQTTSFIKNPVDQTKNMPSIVDEWKKQVSKLIRASDRVESASNIKAYASVEPYWAYCKEANITCTDTNKNLYADIIRLHWEGDINPDLNAGSNIWCAGEAILECASNFFGCLYNLVEGAPVCDAVAGSMHTVLDTWIRPAADSPESSNTPLKFYQGEIRVAVESGVGSSAMTTAVRDAASKTKIADIVTAAIYDMIGGATCSSCAADQRMAAGAKFLGVNDGNPGNWVKRVQSTYFLGDSTNTGQWGDFLPNKPSQNGSIGAGAPHLLYFDFLR